jgi:hypothetical protein
MEQAFVPVCCVGTKRALTGRFVRDGQSWNLADLRVSGDVPPPSQRRLDTLQGNFGIGAGYQGCPDCGRKSYARCGDCGELTCWAGSGTFRCASCDRRGEVSVGIHEVRVENFS